MNAPLREAKALRTRAQLCEGLPGKSRPGRLTSPIEYRRTRGKPIAADVAHGGIHVRQQIDVINPRIVVLLGSTACLGVRNQKIAVQTRHGSLIERDGRTYLMTCHPAAAARFPAIRRLVQEDFRKLKELMA